MLRVLAISAPHYISAGHITETYSFTSQTPFSLQNALRDAISKAVEIKGVWGQSNLAEEKSRNDSVFLMQYWEEEKELLKKKLKTLRPNLLLIGTMTLGFPGAIAAAKLAKEILGNDVCIVIGGKHVNESLFYIRNEICNLQSSPLRLMAEKLIPRVFDVVISGDGEKIITRLGEAISKLNDRGLPVVEVLRYKSFLEEAEGDWLAGQLMYEDSIVYFQSKKSNPIDYETLSFPSDKFELTAGFKIFKTDLTAHAYSDISKGCAYNCYFCSEKGTINGKLRIKNSTTAKRLFQQFKLINQLQKTKYKDQTISVFVEDSIFLGGLPEYLDTFHSLMQGNGISLPFGVQFTLDTFLQNLVLIGELRNVGLKYVAFGVETQNENIASTFSKNSNKQKGWAEKTEEVVLMCKSLDLDCGMFLLWGLGETQKERVDQLNQIIFWKTEYKINIEVGLNIATIHPLRDQSNTISFTEWGTDADSPYLNLFIEMFGEASEKYVIDSNKLPSIDELKELREIFFCLQNRLATHV